MTIADINHYWLEQSWYNFMSSEWGGIVVKIVGLIIFGFFVRWVHKKVHAHLECHVEGCTAIGSHVEGTSYRACKPHHPHHQETITPEVIAKAAYAGHPKIESTGMGIDAYIRQLKQQARERGM